MTLVTFHVVRNLILIVLCLCFVRNQNIAFHEFSKSMKMNEKKIFYFINMMWKLYDSHILFNLVFLLINSNLILIYVCIKKKKNR